MAWLLIRAFSDTKETAWKLGDVVEVRDDAYVEKRGWGTRECLPRFYRVHLTDVDAADIKAKLEAVDETVTVDERTGEETRTLNRVRKVRLDTSALAKTALDTLKEDRSIDLTATTASAVLKDNADRAVSITASAVDRG